MTRLLPFALVALAGCSGTTAVLDAPTSEEDPAAAVAETFDVASAVTLVSAALPAAGPHAELVPVADELPVVEVGLVIDEPAPVEDPVQFEAPQAPVRMALSQARRRVVLLPGVGEREAAVNGAFAEVSDADGAGRVIRSRAVVVTGADGRREVRYVGSRSAPLDLGAIVGCDGQPVGNAAVALRGLRASSLRRGMRGEAVRVAQHLLCAAGHPVEATGRFGRSTDRAVRAFQRAHNASGRGARLVVDGALGAKTRAALDAAIAARSAR